MTANSFAFYYGAVIWMLLYLFSMRRKPMGATFFFIVFVLFFHAFAYPYYIYIWTEQLGFGLLQDFVISFPDLVPKVTLAMALCYSFILLGCHAGDIAFGAISTQRLGIDTIKPSIIAAANMKTMLTLVSVCELLLLSLLILQYAFVASPTALFDYYLSDLGSSERVAIRRTETLSFYIPAILHLTVMPMLLFIVFIEALKSKSTYLKHRAFRFGALLVLLKLSTFSKAAPALILIQLLFCKYLYSRQTLAFSLRYVRFGLIALGIAFGFVFIVRGESVDMETAFDDYFYRLLMIPNEGIFEYFNAIPDYFPFGYGSGLGVITELFGDARGTGQNLPTYNLVASVYRHDYDTVVNSFFIAEAWAQFSWGGVVVLSFMAGLLVKWYDSETAKLKNSSIRVGMVVFSVYGTYALSTSAITTALITGGLFIIPIFARFLDSKL
ncbi:MAG: hypothetical protein M0P95_08370 [Sulfuritalea sp.]|jgi:hypothetical protein|nr:hypothetical protein [Sulfuritalea sp.]